MMRLMEVLISVLSAAGTGKRPSLSNGALRPEQAFTSRL